MSTEHTVAAETTKRRSADLLDVLIRAGLILALATLCYQVFADAGTTLELRALNVDQHYHIAIEAFDERGVSARSTAIALP